MSSRFGHAVAVEIVTRARAGDRSAQAELFVAYGRAVYGLARRLLGRADLAEDVLQDTFVEVLRNMPSFRGEAPVGMWIRRIAVNECLMQMRSHWHRRLPLDGENDATPVESRGREAEHLLDFEKALDALPPEARAVVWLHDVEGYTHREIAQLVNATPSYSKSQLARAYVRMQRWSGKIREVQSCMPALSS